MNLFFIVWISGLPENFPTLLDSCGAKFSAAHFTALNYPPEAIIFLIITFFVSGIIKMLTVPDRSRRDNRKLTDGTYDGDNPYWVPEKIPKGEMSHTLSLRYDSLDRGYDKFDKAVLLVRSDAVVMMVLPEIREMAYMRDVRVLNELILIVTDSEHVLRKRTDNALAPAMKSLTHQIPFIDEYMRELLIEYIDEDIIYKLISKSRDLEFIPLLKAELITTQKQYEEWTAEDPDNNIDNVEMNQFYLNKLISMEDLIESLKTGKLIETITKGED